MELLCTVAEKQDRTILMTLHQPSDDVLHYIHQLVVMMRGKVMFNEKRDIVNNALTMQDNHERLSDFMHKIVKHGSISKSMELNLMLFREEDVSIMGVNTSCGRMRPTRENRHPLDQVVPLGRRLCLEYGWNLSDLFVLPICFCIMSFVLSFDPSSRTTVFIGSLFLFFVPIIIFQHHVLLGTQMWLAHRWEIDDRRIFLLSYQIATLASSLSIPCISTGLSLILSYAILGWDWASFPNQFLFGCVFLLVIISFGRCLSLIFKGKHEFFKVYLLCIFLNVCFGGLLGNPSQAPPGARWLFGLSFTFWAFSGVLTNQFEHNKNIGETPCLSFATSVVYDGNFLSAQAEFWPFANARVALNVLTCIYLFLVVAEFLLLRKRRAHVWDPSSAKQLDKQRSRRTRRRRLS